MIGGTGTSAGNCCVSMQTRFRLAQRSLQPRLSVLYCLLYWRRSQTKAVAVVAAARAPCIHYSCVPCTLQSYV